MRHEQNVPATQTNHFYFHLEAKENLAELILATEMPAWATLPASQEVIFEQNPRLLDRPRFQSIRTAKWACFPE